MKVLVAGGAGFIGSHLVRRLVQEGHRVTVLDNFSSGTRHNLKGLEIDIIRHDIVKPLRLSGFHQIYHLASLASPIFYQRKPIETALSNSIGTYNLLNEARKNGASFLFTSTSEIYGDPLTHPQREDYWGNVNPNGLRSCYDESKRLGESLTMDFHREFGLKTHIARIFNTYGPNMGRDDGRVISNFIPQAQSNTDITIYGNGSQTRSFSYVDDTVNGLVKLMASEYREPVNIGNPNELTIKEIAEKIIKLTGSKSKITYKKLPKDDPRRRCPDIALAKRVLKWQPKITLDQGLRKTIIWHLAQK